MVSVLNRHIISQIVSGGARGADSLAARYAREYSISLVEFYPDWHKYNKKAPFVRNRQIVNSSDIVIAFWDGKSSGTRDSLNYAKMKKIKSLVVNFDGIINIY